MERWKDIKGYEGLYRVSNQGRVLSLNYRGSRRTEILNQRKTQKGYMTVGLSKDGQERKYMVHRLVAQAFIPNPDNKSQVDHKNTKRDDNRAANLKWVTARENANNPLSKKHLSKAVTGSQNPFYGHISSMHHGSRKIIQLTEDGQLVRTWNAMADVTREMDWDYRKISQCCSGQIKSAFGFKWMYWDLDAYLIAKMKRTIAMRNAA